MFVYKVTNFYSWKATPSILAVSFSMLGSSPFWRSNFSTCLKLLVDLTGIGWNLHPPSPGVSPKQIGCFPRLFFMGLWALFSCSLVIHFFVPGVVGKRTFHFENNNLCGFLLYFVCGQPCSSTVVFVGILSEGFRLEASEIYTQVKDGERRISQKELYHKGTHEWSNTFYCKCHFHGISYQKDARHAPRPPDRAQF